jgi:hypothetical protein
MLDKLSFLRPVFPYRLRVFLGQMLTTFHLFTARLLDRFQVQSSYRVDIGHPDRIVILLVGCGGVGSFAAEVLAQLASGFLISGQDLRLYFIDPARVESISPVDVEPLPAQPFNRNLNLDRQRR